MSVALDAPTLAPAARPVHTVVGSWLLVGLFWWLSTGVLFALQRSNATRVLALALASIAACAGFIFLARSQDDRTPGGARRAAFGAAFVWAWVSATLYGGWLVGPPIPVRAGEPSLALAFDAMHATLYHEIAAVGACLLIWRITRRGLNRTGLAAFVLMWGAHELARLNLFFGVANPALDLLPKALEHLAVFFGPARSTPLLALSGIGFGLVTVVLTRRGLRSEGPYERHAASLLAAFALFATLEFILLATTWQPPVWDPFLVLRGG